MSFYQNPIRILDPTSSSSASSGALVVDGGVGIGGDLHVAGNAVSFHDNFIILNDGATGGSVDSGVLFARHPSDVTDNKNYAGVIYDETSERIKFGYVSSDPERGSASLSSTIDVEIGSLTGGSIAAVNIAVSNIAASVVSAGTFTMSSVTTGSVSASTIVGITVSAGTLVGTTVTGGNISVSGTVSAGSAQFAGDVLLSGATRNIGTSTTHDLRIRTNNTDRIAVTSAGNVGIGTTSPSSILHVVGACSIDGNNILEFGRGVSGKEGNAGKMGYATFSTALDIVGAGTASGSRNVRIYDNLGIGTSSPSAPLQINQPVAGMYATINSRSVRIFGTAVDSGHDGTLTINSTTAYARNRGASIALGGRMNNFGGGNLHATFARIKGVQAEDRDSYNGNFVIEVQSDGSLLERVRVNHSGDMFIKGAQVSTSDNRIKKNIQDIDDNEALSILRNIQPKTYNYIENVKGNDKVYGFIAQQIETVLPYAVHTTKGYVPNIYSNARFVKDIENNNTIIHIQSENAILLDQQSSLIFEVVNTSTKTISHVIISQVVNNLTYITEDEIEEGEYFIFGQVVDNFKHLNKDAIWTVATAALQEVDRQLQAEKEAHAGTASELADVKTELAALKTFLSSKFPGEI
jgi:hypothetical protein